MIEAEWHRRIRALPGKHMSAHIYQTGTQKITEPAVCATLLSVTQSENHYRKGVYAVVNVNQATLGKSPEIAGFLYEFIKVSLNPPRSPFLESCFGMDILRLFVLAPYGVNRDGFAIVRAQLLLPSKSAALIQALNQSDQA